MLFNVAPLLDGRNQVAIIGAVFLGFFIKQRFFKSKVTGKYKSPLIADSRRPLIPLETEQAKRDVILKKGAM